jgi:hypothetical protein
MVEKKKRKKRSDRLHILYQLTLVETGETYIGLSAVIGQARKRTLEVRFRRHLSRATTEGKGWTLHKRLRRYKAPEAWEKVILKVVRGRKNAHQAERELIRELAPELNTF